MSFGFAHYTMPSGIVNSKSKDGVDDRMSWASRSSPIMVGDRVAYSVAFLRSISCFSGHLPQARGTVTAVEVLSADVVLATVDWGDPDVPGKVNLKNLCRVNERGFSHD